MADGRPVPTRVCVRPACSSAADAALTFSYVEQRAVLGDLAGERIPQSYELCSVHAERTAPPVGWDLVDTRGQRGDAGAPAPRDGYTPSRVER